MQTLEAESPDPFLNSFSLYLFGWFIFTFLLWILTLRSTVAFSLLFFTLMLAFLFLALAYLLHSNGAPHTHLLRAGGAFGIVAAFAAWYVYSLRVSLSVYLRTNHTSLTGTTLSRVWQTPATPSSSSPLCTSPGLRRDVSDVARSTTAPSARCKDNMSRKERIKRRTWNV